MTTQRASRFDDIFYTYTEFSLQNCAFSLCLDNASHYSCRYALRAYGDILPVEHSLRPPLSLNPPSHHLGRCARLWALSPCLGAHTSQQRTAEGYQQFAATYYRHTRGVCRKGRCFLRDADLLLLLTMQHFLRRANAVWFAIPALYAGCAGHDAPRMLPLRVRAYLSSYSYHLAPSASTALCPLARRAPYDFNRWR